MPWAGAAELVTVPGVAGGPRLHPVEQVRRYCDYLADYTKSLHDHSDPLAGAAYLHNAGSASRRYLPRYPQDLRGRLFSGASRDGFLNFLRSRLDPGVFGCAVRRPFAALRGRPFSAVAHRGGRRTRPPRTVRAARRATESPSTWCLPPSSRPRAADHKTVVVISGGPGPARASIALSLMGELAARGRTVVHATGSRASPRPCGRSAAQRKQRASTLFNYFNPFMNAERNGLDVLILDEAHRIRETSVSRYTPDRHCAPARPKWTSSWRPPGFRYSCSTSTKWSARVRWERSAEIRAHHAESKGTGRPQRSRWRRSSGAAAAIATSAGWSTSSAYRRPAMAVDG